MTRVCGDLFRFEGERKLGQGPFGLSSRWLGVGPCPSRVMLVWPAVCLKVGTVPCAQTAGIMSATRELAIRITGFMPVSACGYQVGPTLLYTFGASVRRSVAEGRPKVFRIREAARRVFDHTNCLSEQVLSLQ